MDGRYLIREKQFETMRGKGLLMIDD